MDYDQWKPLGRGDPLKNDPTYDYVPPKLDRVHYWVDTTPRKPEPDPQKTEILVLGVSSKKSSTGASNMNARTDYDSLLKFLDGTKLGNAKNNYPRQRPHYSVPVTYFPSSFYSTKNRHQERINYSKGEQRVPYTMLVPPPMPSSPRPQEMRPYKQPPIPASPTTTVATPTATPTSSNFTANATSVTVQESKLVYQSSSLSVADDWQRDHVPSAGSHFPTIWNSTAQKNKATSIPLVLAPESYILKERYPKPNENAILTSEVFEDSIGSGSSVMEHTNAISPPMRKGQVTDESMDISNTYVNIGKPDAQIQATSLEDMAMSMDRSASNKETAPMTLQIMQTMQTMQPPPVHRNFSKPMAKPKPPITSLHALLRKEITQAPITTFRPSTTPNVPRTTTTPLPPTTSTTPPALTTDTLFKHYKQPVEPLKGPMYLIIQGHSKVKTYGPTKSVHGIQVQETNEIPTAEEDQKVEYLLQDHLHGYPVEDFEGRKGKSSEEGAETREERSGGLLTLSHAVQSGLGAKGVPLDRMDDAEEEDQTTETEESTEKARRGRSRALPSGVPSEGADGDVQETELEVRYEVPSGGAQDEAPTSERYFKGIVEAGDMSRKLH